MKKYVLPIVIIISVIAFLNIAYYFITNYQDFFGKRVPSPLDRKEITYKVYSNPKIGIELSYPELWTVNETDGTVEIHPVSAGIKTYFGIALRNEFKTLDEVQGHLAKDLPTTPVQIGGATGFKYTDTPSIESNWVSHNNKVYVIRVYAIDRDVAQIVSSLKFKD